MIHDFVTDTTIFNAIHLQFKVGPYVFEEQHEKSSIVWNNENGTVTYRQIRTWVFQPHLSNGDEEELVRFAYDDDFPQEPWRMCTVQCALRQEERRRQDRQAFDLAWQGRGTSRVGRAFVP